MGYRGDATKVNITTPMPMSTRDVKIWAGTVVSKSNGSWQVDLSKTDFKTILSVTATAQLDTNNASAVPIAGIRNYTLDIVNGWVVQSNSFSFFLGGTSAGLKFCTVATVIHVQVIGI